MKNCNSAFSGADSRITCRIVDGMRDVAVLQIVLQLIHRHNCTVGLRLFRGSAKMRCCNAAAVACYRRIREIRYITAYLSCINGSNHCLFVNKYIAGHVKNNDALLHLIDGFFGNVALGGIHCRNVNRNDVAVPIDLVDIRHVRDLAGKTPGVLNVYIRVKAVNVHAKIYCRICNTHANGTKTDDAELLAIQLGSCKLLLLLLHLRGDVRIVPVGTNPVNAFNDITGCKKHSCNHKLLHAVCIGAGSIEYDNSLLGAAIQRNVVDPGTCSCDGKQIVREFHVMHLGTADENSGSLLDLIGFFKISVKAACADSGNVIQFCIFEHDRLLLLHTQKSVLRFKFLHKGNQLLDTLDRHSIVHGCAHASDRPMSLQGYQAVRSCFLDKFSIQIRVSGYERSIHQRTVLLPYGSLKELRFIQIIIENSGLFFVIACNAGKAALLHQPLEYKTADVNVVARRRVVKGILVCLRLVAQHGRNIVRKILTDQVLTDDCNDNTCRSDVLLNAAEEHAVLIDVNRTGQEV